MYMCERCGCLVEEIPTDFECRGYSSLGDRFEEEVDGRCECGGEFGEAIQCPICGEWGLENDYGVCDECFKEHETVENALGLGEYNTESVEINEFIAKVLGEEQINKILAKWVEENFVDHSAQVVDYCREDRYAFADYLEETYGAKK